LKCILSYGAGEVEATLFANLGTGTTELTISPSGTSESASNPEFVISNMQLVDYTPITGAVGELSMVTASFIGGTYVRDITP
jgi:hypothetical protein